MTTQIDITGLSPSQILKVQEFANHLKEQSAKKAQTAEEDEELKQLHEEFDWLIADIGVKTSIRRSEIYGIE
jgi:hypothetical protein